MENLDSTAHPKSNVQTKMTNHTSSNNQGPCRSLHDVVFLASDCYISPNRTPLPLF